MKKSRKLNDILHDHKESYLKNQGNRSIRSLFYEDSKTLENQNYSMNIQGN